MTASHDALRSEVSVDASADTSRRFGGLERLYGMAPAERLRQSCIVVVGIGGVGSWSVEALARSGVGRLVLVDMDHVSESNVNRQIHALTDTIGQSKVLAMRDRIAQIHPGCVVDVVDDFVDADNWLRIVPPEADAVIDACDDARAKTAMAQWSRENRRRVEFVAVGAAGGKRRAQAVEVADLSLTTHDPLLAQVRYRLRKQHGAPRDGKSIGVACVFSREAVAPPDPSCAIEGDGSLNCHGFGSAVSVTATFGMVAAGHVLDRLAARASRPL